MNAEMQINRYLQLLIKNIVYDSWFIIYMIREIDTT